MKPERRGLVLIVVVLTVSASLGWVYGPNVKATTASADSLQESVRQFTKVLDVVQANYAEPVDVDQAVYTGAIPGMLRVLDPHSNFFDAKQFALNMEETRGRYYGVGMTIVARDNHIMVLSPYVGSPAFNAGLRPGDLVVHINDKDTDGMTTSEVADLLKGPRGTAVTVMAVREGYPQPLVFTLTRGEIPHPSIALAFMLKPGIGYVRLTGFSETTNYEMAHALQQLNARTLDGLILDMRGNPGGVFTAAVGVSDMFLDKNQLIVSQHGRNSPEQRYYAVRGNQGLTAPLVILVNNNSASATEIVSGAIQDHDRGLIIGETTFGKGLVQSVGRLSENTGLALTTARYYTPSGRLIQRDYKSMSLYEYHYERKTPDHPTEVRLTDGGRQVTGGGGIAPDVAVSSSKLNKFQQVLLQSEALFPAETGVGGFTRYFMGTKPAIGKDFEVDDNLMLQFRQFLARKNVSYTEADFAENRDWVKRKIKQEVFLSMFGQQEGFKVLLEGDPQLQAAVDALPKAAALYQNAKKIIAQRSGTAVEQP